MTLIDQVRRKLNITWADVDTDGRVDDIIASAIPTMIHRLGIADADYDFSTPGLENTLFLAYCLYEYNHAANEFADNYAQDIATCRAIHEVAYHKKMEADANAESS